MSEQTAAVGVQNQCEMCAQGEGLVWTRTTTANHSRPMHPVPRTRGEYNLCKNFDNELRHLAEPLGFYRMALWPVRCRNGKWRWFRWIEDHGDGTYSLGNRAH